MKITNSIELRRRELKLTQTELARMVGLTQSAISMIESGERCASLPVMLRIASALNCTVEELTKDRTA